MSVLFTNDALSTINGAISDSATTIVLTTDANLFPSPTGDEYAYLTLFDFDGSKEIVKLTARSGTSCTVARGQEGTTAVAWPDGSRIELRATAAGLNSKLDKSGGTLSGDLIPDGDGTRDLGSAANRFAAVHADVLDAQNLVGQVSFFAMNTAPDGWLKANGAMVSRTTYAALFAAIGTTFGVGDGSTTFTLPDLRGEFIRGWDDARGVDSSRVFGSNQNATKHMYLQSNGTVLTYPAAYTPTEMDSYSGTVARQYPTTATNDGTVYQNYTARPRNVALLACIKY